MERNIHTAHEPQTSVDFKHHKNEANYIRFQVLIASHIGACISNAVNMRDPFQSKSVNFTRASYAAHQKPSLATNEVCVLILRSMGSKVIIAKSAGRGQTGEMKWLA